MANRCKKAPADNQGEWLIGLMAIAGVMALVFAQPAAAQEKPVKVTFIQHCCSGATFFQPMQFGAEEAARLFNVKLTYVNADGDADACMRT